jgi:FMN-dependent NADH-azoreductase
LADIEFVYAEGLAMGEQSSKAGLAKAEKAIVKLVEPLRNAA